MSADNVVEMAVWTCSLEDDMRSFLSFVRRAVWAIGSWSVRYSRKYQSLFSSVDEE